MFDSALSVWMLALSLLISKASCGHIQKSSLLLPRLETSGVLLYLKLRYFPGSRNVSPLHLSGPSAPDCTVCCLLLDACPVLPSQLDNATNTATPNTQVFTEHQVTDSQFHSLSLLSLYLYFSLSAATKMCCMFDVERYTTIHVQQQ